MNDCEGTKFHWHFGKKRPDEVERNPIPAEFFVSESRELADNLVREAIQNALDARLSDSPSSRQPAHVRFFLSGTEGALPSSRVERWFSGLNRHLRSGSSGLKSPPCDSRSWEKCEFLTCEDFGTHGLAGDPEQCEATAGEDPADFYNFFRADALSTKGGGQGGTWGVGKTVFPMASRANAFIGLTVQEGNSRRLLMGRSILRYHKASADGPTYRSDGFFGCPPDDDGLVMPLRDMPNQAILDDFVQDFCLAREPGQPGLSVVVPWCRTTDSDGTGVSIDGLRQAVLEHFFWAIVSGALRVTLASPNSEETIGPPTLNDTLGRIAPDVRGWLAPLVALATWASQQRGAGELPILDSVSREWRDRPPDWRDCLGEQDVAPLAETLQERRRVAMRIPVTLSRKKPTPFEQPSHFDIFMEEAEEALRPAFHRDLLLICDEPRRPQTVQGFRTLVIADDFGLARFLATAEVPSHDHWEPTQRDLAYEYAYSTPLLAFVRNSVKHLGTNILNSRPAEVDHTLTMDFFPRPLEEKGRPTPPKGPGNATGDEVTKPPPDPPPSSPRALAIDGSNGSVKIRPGDAGSGDPRAVGHWLNVVLAYNIRRGNPLRSWQPIDFRLDGESLQVTHEGLSEVQRRDNWFSARIDDPVFSVDVSGLDPNRDVYVRASVDEDGAGS